MCLCVSFCIFYLTSDAHLTSNPAVCEFEMGEPEGIIESQQITKEGKASATEDAARLIRKKIKDNPDLKKCLEELFPLEGQGKQ